MDTSHENVLLLSVLFNVAAAFACFVMFGTLTCLLHKRKNAYHSPLLKLFNIFLFLSGLNHTLLLLSFWVSWPELLLIVQGSQAFVAVLSGYSAIMALPTLLSIPDRKDSELIVSGLEQTRQAILRENAQIIDTELTKMLSEVGAKLEKTKMLTERIRDSITK